MDDKASEEKQTNITEQLFRIIGDLFVANIEPRITSLTRKRNAAGAALVDLFKGMKQEGFSSDELFDALDDLLERADGVDVSHRLLAGIFNPDYLPLYKDQNPAASGKEAQKALSEEATKFNEQFTYLHVLIGRYIGIKEEELQDVHRYSERQWQRMIDIMRIVRTHDVTGKHVLYLSDVNNSLKKKRNFVENTKIDAFYEDLSSLFTKEELDAVFYEKKSLCSILTEKNKKKREKGEENAPLLPSNQEYIGIMAVVARLYKGDTTTAEGRKALHRMIIFAKNHDELSIYIGQFRDPNGGKVKDYVAAEKEEEFRMLLSYHLPKG